MNEARQKWIAFLKQPEREKTTGILESPTSPEQRCCLGHACAALGISRKRGENDGVPVVLYETESAYLPISAAKDLNINEMGTFTDNGFAFIKDIFPKDNLDSLATLNDETGLSPQEIAEIIEKLFVIDGIAPYAPLV